MKYFGFIKEHDNYDYAKPIADFKSDTENPHRQEVIDYLKKGKLCVPFMGCVENVFDPNFDTEDYEDDTFTAYMAIDTDGTWYWPRYIVAYLELYPKLKIADDFLKHALKNKDAEITISDEEILKLEKNYYEKAGFMP